MMRRRSASAALLPDNAEIRFFSPFNSWKIFKFYRKTQQPRSEAKKRKTTNRIRRDGLGARHKNRWGFFRHRNGGKGGRRNGREQKARTKFALLKEQKLRSVKTMIKLLCSGVIRNPQSHYAALGLRCFFFAPRINYLLSAFIADDCHYLPDFGSAARCAPDPPSGKDRPRSSQGVRLELT